MGPAGAKFGKPESPCLGRTCRPSLLGTESQARFAPAGPLSPQRLPASVATGGQRLAPSEKYRGTCGGLQARPTNRGCHRLRPRFGNGEMPRAGLTIPPGVPEKLAKPAAVCGLRKWGPVRGLHGPLRQESRRRKVNRPWHLLETIRKRGLPWISRCHWCGKCRGFTSLRSHHRRFRIDSYWPTEPLGAKVR